MGARGVTVERVTLANGEAVQALVPGVEPVTPCARAMAVLAKRRATVRGFEPMPAGGLFDEVVRRQVDFFG